VTKIAVANSSKVVSFGYDADQQVLEIDYKWGTTIRYLEVSAPLFEAFTLVESKGSFLARHIERKLPYERVPAAVVDLDHQPAPSQDRPEDVAKERRPRRLRNL
jgi:hypothetical protein